MTDNEIIKALECCSKQNACNEECPLCDLEHLAVCMPTLLGNALDLINRQKEQIKKLENIDRFATKTIEKQSAEIKRLNGRVEATEISKQKLLSCFKTAKSEAITDFAERLKNEIISDTAYGCDANQQSGYYDYSIKIGDIPEYIDNLVKEMTESVNYGASKMTEQKKARVFRVVRKWMERRCYNDQIRSNKNPGGACSGISNGGNQKCFTH